jgi:hypothetical protein
LKAYQKTYPPLNNYKLRINIGDYSLSSPPRVLGTI